MALENELNEITLDGRRYISVKRAAALADYTTDYVGQLCRGGKIEATRMGRNWYVDEASLIEHKQSQVFKEKQSESSDETSVPIRAIGREPKRQPFRASSSLFRRSFIVYRHDDRPLLPQLMRREEEREEKKPAPAQPQQYTVSLRDIIYQNAAAINAPAYATAPLSKRPFIPRVLAFFGTLMRPMRLAVAFAVLAGLIFSLNGSYAASLIIRGVGSMRASVMSTPLGETMDVQAEPFRYAAREFNAVIDDAVYRLAYPGAPREQ